VARVIERPKARPGREAGNAAGWAGRGRWATVVLALPVVWTIAMGWSHRWIADDGFINVRVVSEVFAGHGPVFNPGERVEVASSPLWLSLLVVGRAVSRLETEWVAVLAGIVTTATAVAVAEVSAARFFRTWRLVPFGILGYVLLPPAWDYTTSGLENSLSILWIACVQLALVTTAHSRRPRQVYVTAALVGLGPLVRPDFVVMSIVFAVALVLLARPASWRRWLALAGVGLALPLAYELFRAAYYGALMPNTAFAKEPEASKWAWGWRYLTDFAKPYWLWLPLVFVAVVTVLLGRDRGRRDRVLLMAAPVAGLLHAFFVVRGGGDHMHARMLLPAWFALLLPAAAIPFRLPSRVAHRVGAAFAIIALGAWALVPVFSGGPPYTGYGPHGIDDERSVWVARSDLHPVTVEDYARDGTYLARYFIKEGRLGSSLRREHQGVLFGFSGHTHEEIRAGAGGGVRRHRDDQRRRRTRALHRRCLQPR
jgi:arabinofuranosyltransferase